MRAMAILYIGPKRNPDFAKDYYISPILTPAQVLVYFPPVLMVCGEKDPFVDDTVIFGGRLREAKRARRAVMLAARQGNAGESLRMSRPSTSNHGHAGLRGDDARRAREQAILYEDERDWVDMRILEGWGHGFLQMTSPLMLGRAAENVIDEMAEWIVDAFTVPKNGRVPHQANGAPLLAGANAMDGPVAKRSPPPRILTPTTAPTSSDIPSPRHARRSSSVAPSTRRAPSPPPSSATRLANGRASSPATRSRLIAPDLPLVSSGTETETERDIPLTFTVARKPNSNGNRTPRNSFGAAEHQAPLSPPRRSLLQHTSRQSGPSSIETAVVQQKSLLPSSSSTSSPSSPENAIMHHLNDANAPLSPATTTATETAPSIFAASFGFGGGPDLTPKQSASPKPGGITALISQTELMRRRREEAVFGLGESEAADDDGGMTQYGYGGSPVRTRSPSPVAVRRGGHTRNGSISSAGSIDKNANGV